MLLTHSLTSSRRKARQRSLSYRGFSLAEAVIGMFILVLLTGAIFSLLNQVQFASSSESAKMDSTQEAREFVDQIVRDVHMAGYPKATMYAPGLNNTSPLVAAGLARVSPTEILLEGDVETSGTVYSVDTVYVPQDPANPNCPCIRRSEAPKMAADPLSQTPATQYTQVEQLIPPGTGAGQAGENLFTFFDANGNPVNVGTGVDISTAAGQGTISSIKTIKINLSLLPLTANAATRQRVSLTVTGFLNNN